MYKDPVIYVAAPFTDASPRLTDFLADFKSRLRLGSSAIVLEWTGKEAGEALGAFYRRDMENVHMCSVMIAIVDEPSIGLGMEICEAIHLHKPVLCLHRSASKLSRLVSAAVATGDVAIEQYRDVADAAHIASQFIEQHRATAVS